MSRKIESSFHGKIAEIPGIYADNFENAAEQDARAYFLSHHHADHIQGLYSEQLLNFLVKNNVMIYTSELTAAIIDHEAGYSRITKYVKGLKMGSTLITLPSIPEKNLPEFIFTVTLIPAGHCAGSTMFLFSTTKNILYTGDFRINTNDLPKYKLLHKNEKPIKLDTVYMDTTFIDTKHDYFPKRSESIEKMIYEIRKWLVNEDNGVAVHTSAKYGYEFVFNEIYKHLNVKVQVDRKRWKFYSSIPHLVPGVTNDETKIHLCKKRKGNSSHTECTNLKNKNYLYLHLSARKWENLDEEICSVRFENPEWMDVCFATHCSRRELEHFVNYLKPGKVVGFPFEFKRNKKAGERNANHMINLNEGSVSKDNKSDKKIDRILLKLMFE